MNSMTDLADKKCIPCEGGIPSFDITEIHKYLKMVDGWEVQSDENKIYFLIKEFKFKDFKESQSFINKVGDIAEIEGHHPDIWFGWGYAKIKIFTHAIKGLHESDFVLAAKIDKITQCLKCLVLEKTRIVSVLFANFIIYLSLIDPDG